MKRRVFLRCFFISLLSVLIVFLSGMCITYLMNRNTVRERLIIETQLAAVLINDRSDFAPLEVVEEDETFRITVISTSGEVLYESDTDDFLENHINREEVAAAIAGEPTTATRYSETLGYKMTYYALLTEFSDGTEAVVRLAVKSSQMNSYLISALPFLLISLVISALVALLFAIRLSARVTARITDISESVRSVSDGDYVPLDVDGVEKEFASVYREINELNEKNVLYMQNEEYEREKLGEVLNAEKELVRQKEEFFANASHELKTPLTAMVGLTELILTRDTDPTTRRQTERIHKESLRLSELISDMLKLSRLETEKDNVTNSSVSVDEVAKEVIAELSEAIAAKNIRATVIGKATVLAEEKRIYEILQNLCSNAVNYNVQDGSLDIILEETESTAIICVRDSGIGISDENIPHLCERFYRVDKSRSKKTGGTGLGLAIVKHICALYNAHFIIKSKLGEGTEVAITFDKSSSKEQEN